MNSVVSVTFEIDYWRGINYKQRKTQLEKQSCHTTYALQLISLNITNIKQPKTWVQVNFVCLAIASLQ